MQTRHLATIEAPAMQQSGITKPQKALQRVAVVSLGWVFIVVGIAGLFLPILPGGVLILAGVLLLNPESPLLRRVLEKCRARFAFLDRALKRFAVSRERSPRL